jgi:alanine-glyoxylate transaminase/serine-glyoxylate transaminase/serine-pyruvate transaminase
VPPAAKLLLGPGPSNAPPAVLEAMRRPLLGHLDPDFLAILDGVCDGLRRLFRTKNRATLPISGTGSAGMEAAFVNFVEPGETVLVGVSGVFGERMADVAVRCGAAVVRVEAPWGRPLDAGALAAAARQARPRLIAVVHGETSTGVAQPLEALADVAREVGALLLVDAVTSLAGMPLDVDALGIDICYSGTQKCLNVPPGLAPLTAGDRAVERLLARRTKVRSWYLDLTMILQYLDSRTRLYHHTAPVSMIYALEAGLKVVHEEGLEARWDRHRRACEYLVRRMAGLGFAPLVDGPHRLWPLTTFRLPPGVEDSARAEVLKRHGIELGGGLGPFKGKVWRIGLMGANARPEVVDRLVEALRDVMAG